MFNTRDRQIDDLSVKQLAGSQQLSWEEGPWKSCTLLHKDITAKVYVSQILCCVFVVNFENILNLQEFGSKTEPVISHRLLNTGVTYLGQVPLRPIFFST